MSVPTSNMYGTPGQTYAVLNNVFYSAALGTGLIANVAQGDVQALTDQGCVSATALGFRTVIGTTDTLKAGDSGHGVRYTNASAVTVTYPAGLGAGYNVLLVQRGAGKVSVQGDGTTVITNRQSQTGTAGQGAECSLVADTADNAIFAGDTA